MRGMGVLSGTLFLSLTIGNNGISFTLSISCKFIRCVNHSYLLQLVNHGIPDELLEGVKNVSSEFYELEREENFKNSKLVNLLNETGEKLENVDWEDVITLLDDNEWPSKTPGFQ